MVFKMIAWLLVVLMVVSGWGCATPSKSYDPHKINVPKEDNIFVSVTLAVLAIVLLAAAAKEARKQKIAMQTAIMEAAKEAGKRQTAIMESWKGHSIAQLIRSWGPPQKIVSDGADGKIYIWTEPVDITLAPGSLKREGTYTDDGYTEDIRIEPPVKIEYDRVRMFWVNSRGIIYHWKWKGL